LPIPRKIGRAIGRGIALPFPSGWLDHEREYFFSHSSAVRGLSEIKYWTFDVFAPQGFGVTYQKRDRELQLKPQRAHVALKLAREAPVAKPKQSVTKLH
jgi:hypothetical protein